MASLNAPPQYYAAERKYSEAKTNEEKMRALEEMLRYCPKHKSAENILMEIKSKMARVKKEAELEKAKKKMRGKKEGEFIKKQGPQLVLVGGVNSGKTALFNAITGMRLPSSDVPFETKEVVPGMMEFNKVQVQVLDTPSITEENKSRTLAFARNADLSAVILDGTQETGAQVNYFNELEGKKLVLVSKKDVAGSKEFKENEFGKAYCVFDSDNVNEIEKMIWDALAVIRVFTKTPREEPDFSRPIVLAKGCTVRDAAKEVHKDFVQNLKFARVWGSAKFPGQQVSGDYELKDGDVIELHMK
ncbi:50S ribosome-binding GTPase [Candidatus Micrarchaeota archaeon]|nr:50S ribosome-binding GTPase [Candidatus Micrarchaeota archaeon]